MDMNRIPPDASPEQVAARRASLAARLSKAFAANRQLASVPNEVPKVFPRASAKMHEAVLERLEAHLETDQMSRDAAAAVIAAARKVARPHQNSERDSL